MAGDEVNRPSPLTIDSTMLNGAPVKIIYSSPAVRKRKIWGELVKYNKMWRTGANDATYLVVGDDIYVNGQLLPSGKYAVFTIPGEEKWKVIINKEWDQWGAYDYKQDLDVMRIDVEPKFTSTLQERMTFRFEEKRLVFHWEHLTFSLDVE
ncbi:MAG: DUF2911 domain-containing protein [Cyclobacteriaceae bacterium]|nr:DUF2911 domain-containing protein [Cyclobacteriaceae bacterium HetDA_MAG_MS6]